MGHARALPKAITTSKTGIYYLYGDYPSQILGDPEHTGKGCAHSFCGVAAIQLRGACNVYGGEVRVRKMQWPARLEGPARIAAVCGKVSYSFGSARCAF